MKQGMRSWEWIQQGISCYVEASSPPFLRAHYWPLDVSTLLQPVTPHFISHSQVSDLAQILNAPLGDIQSALSIASRLGFAALITATPWIGLGPHQPAVTVASPVARKGGDGPLVGNLIDLDGEGDGGNNGPSGGSTQQHLDVNGGGEVLDGGSGGGRGAGEGGRAIALLLDAEATSYLMMGALSPGKTDGC